MFRGLQALAFLCFTFLSFNISYAQSSETVMSGYNSSGEKVFLIRYQEGLQWRVEEVVQHGDGWQDIVSRKFYNYQSEADQQLMKLQNQFSQVQSLNPQAQASSEPMVLQGGSLWPTTQSWSWDWEKKYAQWLTENMNVDFYQKYKIATDCADVVYSARWIFARIHGLPVANRLSAGNVLMTNQSMRAEWQKLPTAKNWYEDKRFRAALDYLLNHTYTHVLMRDSYPISITAQNFLAGAHHLDVRVQSGHAQLVHRVDLSDSSLVPYLIIQSTTPRQVRTLSESLSWGSEQAKKGKNGFLRLLWPKVKSGAYSLEKPENMPGYSLEQYAVDFIREKDRPNFLEVLMRLKPNLNFVTLVQTGYDDLKVMFKNRLAIVDEGFSHCPKRSCAPDSQIYDDWSTPSRDKHITETIDQLNILLNVQLPEPMLSAVIAIRDAALESTVFNLQGEDYAMKSLIFAWDKKLYSSDPNDEPGVRWGVAPEFLSQKIHKEFSQLLTERKNKISIEVDNKLRSYLVLANSYCDYFSKSQCLRLKTQELVKPLQFNGQTRSLQEWLDFSLWLNSDAKQTPANQWGGLRASSKYFAIPEDTKNFYVTNAGVGFLETSQGLRIGMMGSLGLEDAALPANFTWLGMNQQYSVAWAYSTGELLRQDFVSGVQTRFAVPQLGAVKLVRIANDHLLLESAGELWSFKIQGQQLVPIWHGAVSEGHLSNSNYYFGKISGQWNILDFTQLVPKILPVAEDLSTARVLKGTVDYVVFAAKLKFLMVEKATGQLHDLSHLGLVYWVSDGLTKAIAWSKTENAVVLMNLDSQFKIVSSQKFGLWTVVRGEYIFSINMASPPRLYHLKGESISEVGLNADEESIYDYSAPWLIVKLKSTGKMRVRHATGSPVLYEGGALQLLGNQQNPEWAFVGSIIQPDLKIVSLKNPTGPAILMGQYYDFTNRRIDLRENESIISADRGLILNYQGFQFWVEL